MAGKVGSPSFGVLLVDGYNLLAAKLQSFSHKIASVMEKSDGLGDTTFAKSPTGVTQLEVTQGGAFFDDAANGAHALLSPAGATAVSRQLVVAFAGNTIGKPMIGASGLYGSEYEVLSQTEKLTKANVKYDLTGTLDRGVILQNAVAKTVDWNTKTDGFPVDYTLDTSQRAIPIASISTANPGVVTTAVPHGLTSGQKVLLSGTTTTPSVNGQQTATVLTATTFSVPVNVTSGQAGAGGSIVLANTVNGGVGYLAVSDFTGFTGFVGKIRSSPDDITYADLITFSNVTSAPAKERLTVAGTVDRYLSFNGDVTGAGSITPFVGFSRG